MKEKYVFRALLAVGLFVLVACDGPTEPDQDGVQITVAQSTFRPPPNASVVHVPYTITNRSETEVEISACGDGDVPYPYVTWEIKAEGSQDSWIGPAGGIACHRIVRYIMAPGEVIHGSTRNSYSYHPSIPPSVYRLEIGVYPDPPIPRYPFVEIHSNVFQVE